MFRLTWNDSWSEGKGWKQKTMAFSKLSELKRAAEERSRTHTVLATEFWDGKECCYKDLPPGWNK